MGFFQDMDEDDKRAFELVLQEVRDRKIKSSKAKQLREIVPIEKWLESQFYIGQDGMRLYPYWREVLYDIFREDRPDEKKINEAIIGGSIGCLSEDTRIPTSIGFLSLKELSIKFDKGERFQVLSEDGFKNVYYVKDNGYTDTIKITTNQGREIEGTPNHRFRVVDNGDIEWKRLDEISRGDNLVMTRMETPFGKKDIGDRYAYTLGYLSGDGGLTYGSGVDLGINQGQLQIGVNLNNREYLKKGFIDIFGYIREGEYTKDSGWEYVSYRSNNKDVCDYLLENNFGHGSKNKDIPYFIYECNKKCISAYLRGLFDADGTVNKSNIAITLSSKKYIYHISEMLSMFGINYHLEEKKINNDKYRAWRLQIINKESWRLFKEEIGFLLDEKRESLNELCKFKGYVNDRVMVPDANKVLNRLMTSDKLKGYSKNRNLFGWYRSTQGVTFKTIKRLYKIYPEWVSQSDYLIYILENECFFDIVDKMEESKSYTRDLSVEDSPTYCFKGFISHNTGKSTFAVFAFVRKLYELSCYENVPALFDLMSTSLIVFIYFSVTKTQAELTGFSQMRNIVDSIPYFQQEFSRNQNINTILKFPENILFTSGSDTGHAIGMNMLGCILDEANFHQGEKDRVSMGTQDFSKITNLYSTIINRGKSRFQDNGKDDSLSILVSSATHSSSFTQKRIEASVNDPHTMVIDAKLWEVKPQKYAKEKFWVFAGSDLLDPYIINGVSDINEFFESIEEPKINPDYNSIDFAISKVPIQYKHLFIAIPEDFRKSFRTNLVKALQDIAGYSVAPMGRLFSNRPVYNRAIERGKQGGLKHPFYKESFTISTNSSINMQDYLRKGFVFQNKNRPRFIHIDQSINDDSTGFGMVHIDKIVEENGVRKPHIKVDLMVRIFPPQQPQQISIARIRDFIFYLRDDRGLSIKKVSYDWFASQESRQVLNESGVDAEHRSLDRKDEAYLSLINMFYEDRIDIYDYEDLGKELFELVHDRKRGKIDHPTGGCFTGDIKVKLLNGTIKTMKELSDLGRYNEFWVYSCTKEGQIVPVKAHNAHITKKNSELVEVELDNHRTIRCTPEHKFMLRNGNYKEAQYLTDGDSLMPLYWEYEGSFLDGYERVINNKTGRWKLTHRMVAEGLEMKGVNNRNNVIHHYDIDKLNNSPVNLEILSRSEHAKRHNFLAKLATKPEVIKRRIKSYKETYRNSPRLQKIRKETGKRVSAEHINRMVELSQTPENIKKRVNTWRENGYDRVTSRILTKWNKSESGREISRKNAKKLNGGYWKSEEGKKRRKELSKTQLVDARKIKIIKVDKEFFDKLGDYKDYILSPRHAMYLVGGGYNTWVRRFKNIDLKENASSLIGLSVNDMLERTGLTEVRLRNYLSSLDMISILDKYNHKVVSVKRIKEREDVYDITVPKYHNFALDVGIFVHNSKDTSDGVCGAVANALESEMSESAGGDDSSIIADINGSDNPMDGMFSLTDLL